MNFISYNGSIYVTDGFTRRGISNTNEFHQLHAAAGKPPIQPVSKATFDALKDYVHPSVVLNAINSCEALVETHRRIFVDWISTRP